MIKHLYIYIGFFCYLGEALEGPISTRVSKKLNNVDSNNGIQIYVRNTTYIYVLWTFIEKMLLTKHVDQSPHEGKKG